MKDIVVYKWLFEGMLDEWDLLYIEKALGNY
jgi:hypothetical protein